jgi:integrase
LRSCLGNVPLFPSPKDDSKSIRRDLTARWLLNAEKLAGLPKLSGGQFHPYRRLWATERKDLPVQDVAAAGGWKTVETVQRIYQQADGATTLAAVEAGP